MIRKQLVHIISETFNYFFNWDEAMVNQFFLSGMLVMLFCKSLVLALVNFLLYTANILKETVQRYKEQDGQRLISFNIPFLHRHNE